MLGRRLRGRAGVPDQPVSPFRRCFGDALRYWEAARLSRRATASIRGGDYGYGPVYPSVLARSRTPDGLRCVPRRELLNAGCSPSPLVPSTSSCLRSSVNPGSWGSGCRVSPVAVLGSMLRRAVHVPALLRSVIGCSRFERSPWRRRASRSCARVRAAGHPGSARPSSATSRPAPRADVGPSLRLRFLRLSPCSDVAGSRWPRPYGGVGRVDVYRRHLPRANGALARIVGLRAGRSARPGLLQAGSGTAPAGRSSEVAKSDLAPSAEHGLALLTQPCADAVCPSRSASRARRSLARSTALLLVPAPLARRRWPSRDRDRLAPLTLSRGASPCVPPRGDDPVGLRKPHTVLSSGRPPPSGVAPSRSRRAPSTARSRRRSAGARCGTRRCRRSPGRPSIVAAIVGLAVAAPSGDPSDGRARGAARVRTARRDRREPSAARPRRPPLVACGGRRLGDRPVARRRALGVGRPVVRHAPDGDRAGVPDGPAVGRPRGCGVARARPGRPSARGVEPGRLVRSPPLDARRADAHRPAPGGRDPRPRRSVLAGAEAPGLGLVVSRRPLEAPCLTLKRRIPGATPTVRLRALIRAG